MKTLVLSIFLILSFSVGAYDRGDYPHWVDADGDGQDTRQEILIRDSLVPANLNEGGDRVMSGLWVCPYTGRVMIDPGQVDVDHIVALGEIDAAGGSAWSRELRQQFANDPDNLVAVYRGSNRSKSDLDPSEWMPPNLALCEWYLSAREKVWRKYGIEVSDREKRSVADLRGVCPSIRNGIRIKNIDGGFTVFD